MFQKKSLPRPTPPAASIAAAAPPGSDAPSIVGANLTFRGDIVGGGGGVRVEGKVFGRIDVDRRLRQYSWRRSPRIDPAP